MAKVNVTVTPIMGPPNTSSSGKPQVFTTDDGTRYSPVKLSIASGTYAQADRLAMVHTAGSDFFEHYGARIIKNVIAEPMGTSAASTGLCALIWQTASQTLRMNTIGNTATGPVAGNTQLADATVLAGTMTANAVIFW